MKSRCKTREECMLFKLWVITRGVKHVCGGGRYNSDNQSFAWRAGFIWANQSLRQSKDMGRYLFSTTNPMVPLIIIGKFFT
jgi:hypothetical protein